MYYRQVLERYMQRRLLHLVQQSDYDTIEKDDLREPLLRKINSLKERQAKLLKSNATFKIVRKFEAEGDATVKYVVRMQHMISQKGKIYIEEEQELRVAFFKGGVLVSDLRLTGELDLDLNKDALPMDYREDDWTPSCLEDLHFEMYDEMRGEERPKKEYNRLEAVKYAERYWNEYNPTFPQFENNCTNYISQCLHTGGAKMYGAQQPSRGWWLSGKNWSYSWTMANAFYLYLKGAKTGLRGEIVKNPQDLLLGDVICYDFEGDGKYNHSTIVTDKDENGMPLVNANTYNSRNRYWAYEDSTAYTPNIQYTFFRIHI